MLLLFINLYMSMIQGSWTEYTWSVVVNSIKPVMNVLGTFLTSIFGDNTMTNLGDIFGPTMRESLIIIVAFVLALITSIGIVVMAVKGVKKAFGIFFMGIRNI